MNQAEDPLKALRYVKPETHSPQKARELDDRAAELLAGLPQNALATLSAPADPAPSSAASGTQIFPAALVVLHARLKLAADSAAVVSGSATASNSSDVHGFSPSPAPASFAQQSAIALLSEQQSQTQSLDPIHLAQGVPSAKVLLKEYADIVGRAPTYYPGFIPKRWIAAGREATRLAISSPNFHLSKALLLTMRAACDMLAPSPRHVVPLHADYLALCVHAKCYPEAVAFGSQKRFKMDPEAVCIDAADVLCIHYYLSVAHIAIKDYATALQHCRLSLVIPSVNISEIAVSIYKKYILLSLLQNGIQPPAMKNSSYMASGLRCHASEYVELAEAFQALNAEDVGKIIASNQHVFSKDQNLGLLKQLLASLPRRIILRLTSSYKTLSLESISSRTGLHDCAKTEEVLLDMISAGTLRAGMDCRERVIHFMSDMEIDSDRDSAGSRQRQSSLDKSLNRALACIERIHEFKNSILCDTAFISRKLFSEREHAELESSGVGIEDAENDADLM